MDEVSFHLIGTNYYGFHVKPECKRFTASNFTSPFKRLCQRTNHNNCYDSVDALSLQLSVLLVCIHIKTLTICAKVYHVWYPSPSFLYTNKKIIVVNFLFMHNTI